MKATSALKTLFAAALQARPTWLLFALSGAIGLVQSFSLLPISLIAGTGSFWSFPEGTIPNSMNDMAAALVGYTYLQHAPWSIPLLYAPQLGIPTGINVFWLDAVPWVDLVGKAIFSLFGTSPNLLGVHLFLSLALPGVAMTAVLSAAGERSLLAVGAGAIFADSAPWLLFRWGHIADFAQYLLIGSLALYVVALRSPRFRYLQKLWLGLLVFTLLTNIYLTAMVAIFWLGSELQRGIDGNTPWRSLCQNACIVVGCLGGVMLLMGMLTPDLRYAGSHEYGMYSFNMLSPVIPQRSGFFPAFRNVVVGTRDQYEGFAYLGAGTLLLVCAAGQDFATWIRSNWRRHIALIALLSLSLLFAISNKVYVGRFLVVNVPLPHALEYMLGTFRSSGRFFWPIGYTILAAALLANLRSSHRVRSTLFIFAACCIQLLDTMPLREAIAQTADATVQPLLPRSKITALVSTSTAVMVFPSFGCVDEAVASGRITPDQAVPLWRANMELQLAAARADVPTNSVYQARVAANCVAEVAQEAMMPPPGVLYVYLRSPHGLLPEMSRIGSECHMETAYYYCRNGSSVSN